MQFFLSNASFLLFPSRRSLQSAIASNQERKMMAEDTPIVEVNETTKERIVEMDERKASPVRSERGRSPEPRADREVSPARSRGGAPNSASGSDKAPSIYVRGLGRDCQPADLFPIFEKYPLDLEMHH